MEISYVVRMVLDSLVVRWIDSMQRPPVTWESDPPFQGRARSKTPSNHGLESLK